MYGKHAADNWHSVGISSDILIVSQSYLRPDMRIPSSGAGERQVGVREPFVLMWVTHEHSHVQDRIMESKCL
jgi:hypothetical protein